MYGPVPPPAVTVADPLFPPLHNTLTCDAAASVSAGGDVIVNDCVAVQPPAPVTVHVYVPAHSPEAVDPVPPDGAHAYVNGPVPEVMVTDADPLQPPLQEILVCAPESVMEEPVDGTVTATVYDGEQEIASSIVQV